MKYTLRVQVPQSHLIDGIRWLEIEERDGGFYLYQFENIEQPPKWDSFYETLQEILDDCQASWGVAEDAWERLSDG